MRAVGDVTQRCHWCKALSGTAAIPPDSPNHIPSACGKKIKQRNLLLTVFMVPFDVINCGVPPPAQKKSVRWEQVTQELHRAHSGWEQLCLVPRLTLSLPALRAPVAAGGKLRHVLFCPRDPEREGPAAPAPRSLTLLSKLH